MIQNPTLTKEPTVANVNSTLHYITSDDGNHYVSIKDVVNTLLDLEEEAKGDTNTPAVGKMVGLILGQIAVQIATPFMEIDGHADVS